MTPSPEHPDYERRLSPENIRGTVPSQTAAPAMPPEVAALFDAYPPSIGSRLLAVRRLIFATAAATEGVGPLTETLKWGEPAYLTLASKSGSTIRLGQPRSSPDNYYAVYFNCNSTMIGMFRTLFPDELAFEGNRAIRFGVSDPLPEKPLTACLAIALTYHREKRQRVMKRP